MEDNKQPEQTATANATGTASKQPWYMGKKSGKVNPFIRWCYGLAKEFRRIQWMKGSDMIEAIFVVLITILILVGVFWAVDAIFFQGNILAGG